MPESPYAPPAPRRRSTAGDFRERAVAESQRLLGGTVTANAACSFCVPQVAGGRAAQLLEATESLALLAVSAPFFVYTVQMVRRAGGLALSFESLAWLHVLAVVSLGGIVAVRWLGHRVRVAVAVRRAGSLIETPVRGETLSLSLEDAATYHVLKLRAEDGVVAAVDPDARRVVLEGRSHRYLVRAEDVLDLVALDESRSTAVLLEYAIGDVSLAIALSAPTLGLGSGARRSQRLRAKLAQALDPDGATDADTP